MLEVGRVVISATVEDVILDLQELHGVFKDVQELQDDFLVTCPFHKGGMENKPSMGINKEKGLFNCLTCGEKGNIISLVGGVSDLSDKEAYKWLISKYLYSVEEGGRAFSVDLFREAKSVPKVDPQYIERCIRDRHHAYRYLHSRGIYHKNLELFPIGFDSVHSELVLFIQDTYGEIVYVKRRSISTKRYRNTQGVDKSDYMYGASQCKASKANEIWICESELDALTVWCTGGHAIAIGGARISEKQLDTITKELGARVIIDGLDRDDAGRQGWEYIKSRLIRRGVYCMDTTFPEGKKDINEVGSISKIMVDSMFQIV